MTLSNWIASRLQLSTLASQVQNEAAFHIGNLKRTAAVGRDQTMKSVKPAQKVPLRFQGS